MNKLLSRFDDYIDSLTAPEIMTKEEALDFMEEARDILSTKIEALAEEIGL